MSDLISLPLGDIYPREVTTLMNRFLSFIGEVTIQKCLANYHRSLNSSGPIYTEYYLRIRHPWWEPLEFYYNLCRKGKSLSNRFYPELATLISHAKMISVLQRYMPPQIKKSYTRNLLDDDKAVSYLFELKVAWHFLQKGYHVHWLDNNTSPHPEFKISSGNISYNIECKWISADKSRKIRRRDFYRLADKLILPIHALQLCGEVEIILNDRLHADEASLLHIISQILPIIDSSFPNQTTITTFGQVALNLSARGNKPVDLSRIDQLIESKKSHIHLAYFAADHKGQPVDPIILTVSSRKHDNVLDGIYHKLNKSISRQLPPDTPGLVCCHIDGISDFRGLEAGSGIQNMSSLLLNKDHSAHIAAILYSADDTFLSRHSHHILTNQGLVFRNPDCRFPGASEQPLLSEIVY